MTEQRDHDPLTIYLDDLLQGGAWADTGAEAAQHIRDVLGYRQRVITAAEGMDTLHQAIAAGIESGINDFGVDLGCAPATLTGHVIRELKRIPGWRAPARQIKTTEELAAVPVGTLLLDKWRTVWQRQQADWRLLAVSRSDAPSRIVLPGTVVSTPEGER